MSRVGLAKYFGALGRLQSYVSLDGKLSRLSAFVFFVCCRAAFVPLLTIPCCAPLTMYRFCVASPFDARNADFLEHIRVDFSARARPAGDRVAAVNPPGLFAPAVLLRRFCSLRRRQAAPGGPGDHYRAREVSGTAVYEFENLGSPK